MTGRLTLGLGLYTGQRPAGAARPSYGDAVVLAQAAEAAGFDAFWVSEHHGFSDDYVPSPFVLLGALATATTRLMLGTGVALAPLYHPLRLAEDSAVVDQLSAGRLILGLGLGYAEHELTTFGVDTATRGAILSDLMPFLRTAWTGEFFDWAGPAYTGRDLRVTPRPAHEDGVPIWLGGYAPPALRRARRLADGHLIGRTDEAILQTLLPFWETPVGRPFTIGLNVLVLLTDDAGDAAAARAGYATIHRAYDAVQRDGRAHAGLVGPVAEHPLQPDWTDRYMQAVGDPRAVTVTLARLLERLPGWADVHLVLRVLFAEPNVAGQVARIERLGRLVLPGLR